MPIKPKSERVDLRGLGIQVDQLIDPSLNPVDLTELGVLSNVTATAQANGKVVIRDDTGNIRNPSSSFVSPAATVSATEYGDPFRRVTRLVYSLTLPAIAGGAALAVGVLLGTMPSGNIIINRSRLSCAITQSQGNINADTPDVGLGTAIGSGVNFALDTVTNGENIHTGQTAPDCNGTEFTSIVDGGLVIPSGNDRTIHLNVADSWAASGDSGAGIAGEVLLFWDKLDA